MLWLLYATLGGVSAAVAGGWHIQHPPRSVTCGFPSFDAAELTAKEFRDVYEGKQPVLIRGGVKQWPAQTLWTKSHLSDIFRNVSVQVKGPSEDPAFSPITGSFPADSAVRWPDYIEKMSQRQCGTTLNGSDARWQMGSRVLGVALVRVSSRPPQAMGIDNSLVAHWTGSVLHKGIPAMCSQSSAILTPILTLCCAITKPSLSSIDTLEPCHISSTGVIITWNGSILLIPQ
jgi:hypothetical protein